MADAPDHSKAWTIGLAAVGALISAAIGAQLSLFEPRGETMRQSLKERVDILEEKAAKITPEAQGKLTALEKEVDRLSHDLTDLRKMCREAVLDQRKQSSLHHL